MFASKSPVKLILLLIVSLNYSTVVHSQEKPNIEFSIGASLPLPPFSQKDMSKTGAGLAKPGGLINLKVLKRVGKEKFELGLSIRGSIVGFDSKPITDSYEENNPGTYDDWNRKLNGWKVISLMPGIIYNSDLSKKVKWNMGLYLGMGYAKSQEFTLTGNSFYGSLSSNVVIIQKSSDAFALSTSWQTGVYLKLDSKLQLAVSIDYFFIKPTFKDAESIVYGSTTGPIPGGGTGTVSIFHYEGKRNFVQNMNTLNLSTGIRFRL